MALQKRLVLAALIAASLLGFYVLRPILDRPLSWSTGPLRHFHSLPVGGSRDAEDTRPPPDPDQPTSTSPTVALRGPTAQNPAQNDVPGAPESGPRSEGPAGGGARGPTVRAPPTTPPKPTEPAFIGDTYMSEDVPPPTGCVDSVRRRVGGTEFGARFLERVPVLQWAKHATPTEFQRLRQYAGAHGWGGLDYSTLLGTLSVLNSSANRQMLDDWETRRSGASECSRCAVVGNGGILKGSGRGKEIDAHHYVFRTNGAIIQGFEEDVGSRTTHYTFSTNTLMNSIRSYAGAGYKGPPVSKETRYVFLPDHDRDYLLMKAAATHTAVESGKEKGKRPSQYFGDDVSAEKLKMYHPDFIRYLRNRFLRSNALKTKYREIYRPSTGASMLLAALHTCDQVSAYGFMTPNYTNFSDHYYDSTFHPVGFFINHDLRLELQLWQQLHQAGLIRLYMRQ